MSEESSTSSIAGSATAGSGGDQDIANLLANHLPSGTASQLSDAEIDQMLESATPSSIQTAAMVTGAAAADEAARAGNPLPPLPSGRDAHGAAASNPFQLARAAAMVVLLVVAGAAIVQWLRFGEASDSSGNTGAESLEEWRLDFPPAVFVGTPPAIPQGDRFPPVTSLKLPADAKHNVALGKMVTSSAPLPIEGTLVQITDGNRSADASVAMPDGLQWVQVDLGQSHDVFGLVVWHDYSRPVVYEDVVFAISDDPDFEEAVTVVFNNDRDGSAALAFVSAGTDPLYVESNWGRVVSVNRVSGRFVRLYANGNDQEPFSRYVELEVYARQPSRK